MKNIIYLLGLFSCCACSSEMGSNGTDSSVTEVQLVNKYKEELKAVYDGISRPRIKGSV